MGMLSYFYVFFFLFNFKMMMHSWFECCYAVYEVVLRRVYDENWIELFGPS
jgi:hypothetical protein